MNWLKRKTSFLPVRLYLIFFFLIPVIYTAWINHDLIRAAIFAKRTTGLATTVLFTVYFSISVSLLTVFLGLILVLFMNGKSKITRAFIQLFAVFFYILPSIFTAFFVKLIFQGEHILLSIYLSEIMVNLFITTSFISVGIKSLDEVYMQMAKNFKFSDWKILFRLVIPQISTYIYTSLILVCLSTISNYGLILVLGNGKYSIVSSKIYQSLNLNNELHFYQYILIELALNSLLVVILFFFDKTKLLFSADNSVSSVYFTNSFIKTIINSLSILALLALFVLPIGNIIYFSFTQLFLTPNLSSAWNKLVDLGIIDSVIFSLETAALSTILVVVLGFMSFLSIQFEHKTYYQMSNIKTIYLAFIFYGAPIGVVYWLFLLKLPKNLSFSPWWLVILQILLVVGIFYRYLLSEIANLDSKYLDLFKLFKLDKLRVKIGIFRIFFLPKFLVMQLILFLTVFCEFNSISFMSTNSFINIPYTVLLTNLFTSPSMESQNAAILAILILFVILLFIIGSLLVIRKIILVMNNNFIHSDINYMVNIKRPDRKIRQNV